MRIAVESDLQCQEYAAFTLAFLATNRDLQRPLVEVGALKPLVTLMSTQAEPRQYAALAVLKLADNFENHVAIAKAGGLTALLRLGRGGQVDEVSRGQPPDDDDDDALGGRTGGTAAGCVRLLLTRTLSLPRPRARRRWGCGGVGGNRSSSAPRSKPSASSPPTSPQ